MPLKSPIIAVSATLLALNAPGRLLDRDAVPVTCESLASLSLPNTTITRAQTVPAGTFAATPEGVAGARAWFRPYNALRRFAESLPRSPPPRIRTSRRVVDASCRMEREVRRRGQRGLGRLDFAAATGPWCRPRYAIATTDTGHTTRDGSFALNHPEKLAAFGYGMRESVYRPFEPTSYNLRNRATSITHPWSCLKHGLVAVKAGAAENLSASPSPEELTRTTGAFR